jgi:hypothetical protein
MKASKPKQRWAKLTEAEQKRLEDIGDPWPECFLPTKTGPDGSRWADSVLLAAYRSQHTSDGEQR